MLRCAVVKSRALWSSVSLRLPPTSVPLHHQASLAPTGNSAGSCTSLPCSYPHCTKRCTESKQGTEKRSESEKLKGHSWWLGLQPHEPWNSRRSDSEQAASEGAGEALQPLLALSYLLWGLNGDPGPGDGQESIFSVPYRTGPRRLAHALCAEAFAVPREPLLTLFWPIRRGFSSTSGVTLLPSCGDTYWTSVASLWAPRPWVPHGPPAVCLQPYINQFFLLHQQVAFQAGPT